jgi:23S rRNA pseudouridine1911/1915/1917 synthase
MANDSSTEETGEAIAFTVPADGSGQRLDLFLTGQLDGMTRSRVQALLRSGCVTCKGEEIHDISRRTREGECYAVTVPPAEQADPEPQSIPLAIVYEDSELIVIDKPAGLVVHPAAGHASGTLVNALLAHCGDSLSGIGGIKRPGIVHRLDKETSGLLVVAKTDLAHQDLAAQFAAHGQDGRLKRSYLTLVWGVPRPPQGTIDARLGRSQQNRTRIAVMRGEGGRHAVTHYRTLQTYGAPDTEPAASLVQAELETGRTHQIRVHFAHIKHPVLGDPVYGAGFNTSISRLPPPAQDALRALHRQALHATELGFEHPKTREPLHFTSPLPEDIGRLVAALG